MKIAHDFLTPRNLYEKLIRDYEQLDITVSGDNLFNFVSTAYHLLEWTKNHPVPATEILNRFMKRVADDKNIKICRDIASSDKTFVLEISGDTLDESDFKPCSPKPIKDRDAYKIGTRKYTLKIDDLEIDPFEFKEEVMKLYDVYYKIK